MDILVLGDERRTNELLKVIPDTFNLKPVNELQGLKLSEFPYIFDLNFDDNPANIERYANCPDTFIVVGAVKKQLAQFHNICRDQRPLIGMNTLPTFVDRDLKELSLLNAANKSLAEQLAKDMQWNYKIVEDRVGMVTPRIIFMIINEACYTLQEGTASIEDIDLAMKLGTNYPYGPFEWADLIGIKDIYETLAAVYEDTRDERYKICPLLKTKYLKQETFR